MRWPSLAGTSAVLRSVPGGSLIDAPATGLPAHTSATAAAGTMNVVVFTRLMLGQHEQAGSH